MMNNIREPAVPVSRPHKKNITAITTTITTRTTIMPAMMNSIRDPVGPVSRPHEKQQL